MRNLFARLCGSSSGRWSAMPRTCWAATPSGRDFVQETFFRLGAEPRERVELHLREWLYAVCRNLAIYFRRKDRRMQLMGETDADLYIARNRAGRGGGAGGFL